MIDALDRHYAESSTNPVPDGVPVNGPRTRDLPARVHYNLTHAERHSIMHDVEACLGEALAETGKDGLTVALRDVAAVRTSAVQRRDALVRLAAWSAREAALTTRQINDRRILDGKAPIR